ncbi:MAG TPA: Gldg family protein, partial [Opitutaceae bacterium]|nr:Gldg family protein [Opitutaceae bacterium]
MSPDSFRTARWIRTLNLVLQAILFLTLFGGLNYLARNHSWRFDLTHQHRFSLSAETRAYIGSLTQPSRIVVTLTPDSENPANAQAQREISGLLREYTYASDGNPTG